MRKVYLALILSGLGIASFGQGSTCATAVAVTPGTYTADGPNAGGGGIGGGVGFYNADWYSFTAPCNGTVTVGSCGSGVDTRLWMFNTAGCPTGPGAYASNDDFCAAFASEISNVSVSGGTTYYIEWDNFWSSSGFNWYLNFNPVGVTNPIATPSNLSASIDWLPSGSETSWDIEYGIAGFVPGTGTLMNVTSSDAVFSGLTPLTTYEYYITTVGGACGTLVTGPFSFTTLPLCPEPTSPFVTGLSDDAATLNWSAGGLESTWDVEWGPNGFLLGSGTQDLGITPSPVDPLTGLSPTTDYHWYVRAVCDLNTGDGVDTVSYFIGPFDFTTGQVCADPSGLGVINGSYDVDLTWSPGALELQWNIQWGLAGFTPGGTGANLITNVGSYPHNLDGLTPSTTYQFYVQAVCGSGPDSSSSWVGPYTWTTDAYCFDPSGLTSTGLSTTGATISWTPGGSETDWTYEYGPTGFTPGTGTTVTVSSPTDVLTGLAPDTDYCYYVQAHCGSTPDSSSMWVGPHCFSTLVACPAPTNLGAINITNTAANLLWQAGGSETMWNVEWGLPGFMPGTGEEIGSVSGTSSNPYYATGLNPSNTYEYYVQADCGGTDGTSMWVGPYTFNTLFVNDVPCDAIDLTTDGIVYTYSNVLASNDGEVAVVPGPGNCDDNMSWCGFAQIDHPMWFKFTADASGTAYISTKNDITTAYDNHTEIAVYSVGMCDNYSTYTLLGANTGSNHDMSNGILSDPGSEVFICSGLNPGEEYYIMMDAFSGWQYSGWGVLYTPFTGVFGISVEEVVPANAGTSLGASICEDAGSFDLFQTITGNSGTEGVWYNPVVMPGNEMPNVVDFTGVPVGTYPFFYVDGSGCGTDTVETAVTVEAAPDAGMDGAYTTCNTSDIWLITHLDGDPSMGGSWSDDDNTGKLFNGMFKANGMAPGTYDFTYTVSGGATCPDATATVSVTLTDCLGMEESQAAVLSVYPNPVVDVLTIENLDIASNAVLEVYDIQGKKVLTVNVSNVTGNYELDMRKMERGVYVVRITNEESVREVRVVKQ